MYNGMGESLAEALLSPRIFLIVVMAKKSAASSRSSNQNKSENNITVEKWLPWALAGLSFLLFATGFKNEMLSMDDHSATLNNPAVTDFALFSNFNLGMFAPLTWMGYAIAYQIGGESSTVFHVLSALVHAANVLLVFHLLRSLGSNLTVAGFVAFFFATHPIQVESVAWIAGFSTPLFSMFSLLAMHYYVKHCQDEVMGSNFWMAIGMFLLACLAKSAAVTLPFTLLVLDIWLKRAQNIKLYLEKIPFVAISLVFGILTLFSRQHAGQLDQPADFSLLDRGLMACYTILFYWKKIIVPTGLSIWYPFVKTNGAWDWSYYASPVLLAGILFAAWRSRNAMPLLWVGILFYLSNIIVSLPWATFGSFELRSDRYNYLACLGIFIVLTALPAYFSEKKPAWVGAAWAALVGFGLVWMIAAGARILEWKNTISLIESAMTTTGDNFGKAYLWRGIILADQGKGDPALQDFNRALNINPQLYDAYKYRGNIMGLRKNYEASVNDLSKYIKQFPDAAPEMYNRGLSLTNLNQDSLALEDYNRCLKIDPKFYRAYRARGNTYLKLGDTEKGNADLQEYDRLKPAQ